MVSLVLAVIAGMLFGRWLGTQQVPKPAPQKVRVGDLRRSMAGRH